MGESQGRKGSSSWRERGGSEQDHGVEKVCSTLSHRVEIRIAISAHVAACYTASVAISSRQVSLNKLINVLNILAKNLS